MNSHLSDFQHKLINQLVQSDPEALDNLLDVLYQEELDQQAEDRELTKLAEEVYQYV